MSLLIDIQEWYKEEKYPPEGSDLDYKHVNGEWVKGDTDTEKVQDKVIDDSPRWGDLIELVYKRGDEYVAVRDVKPGTEYQSWGDYGDPTLFEVKPVEVTVTRYEKV